MKVILLQELKGKGGEGDVVDVAPGFANNYLLPQGIAILATKGNLRQLEDRKHNIAKREEKRIADANAVKAALDGTTVKVIAQVGDEGQLFGSVTAQMIADAIKESSGIEVDKRRIELGHAIKTAGEHEVSISLYREIRTTVNVLVGGENDAPVAEEAVDAEETEAGEAEVTVESEAGEAEAVEASKEAAE
ncbi:50S ribosomal protein L9 [Gordonibacter sp. An230]|uniref:50S ribosomal protein L9 n=1 Tax=Gordonibacter sp. An230 TaxID=1965592 RepID=UPI000B3AF11D|nr:50S ribosomal protein L9 [Gordonibacter sp. An230]OUO92381.1 50S ribosomal protein L9 [Gordonibacter sp. An230]